MPQGALNLAPTLGALNFFGQVEAQNRARADRKRQARFGFVTGALGATGAGLATGGNPAAISAGFAGGSEIGRGLAGGRTDPGVVLQSGLGVTGAVQQQDAQAADDQVLGALSADLRRSDPAAGGDDLAISETEAGRSQDLQNIIAGARGGPGALGRAGTALQLRGALQGPLPESFTLAPGAARFRGTTEVARNPKEPVSKLPDPRTVTLRKGSDTVTLAREDPAFRGRLLDLTNQGYTTVIQRQDLSAAERKQAAETEAGIGVLDDLQQMFDPSFVGPLDGRKLQAKAFSGIGLNEKEANFLAANAAVENEMIKLFSGAAVSESEEKRLNRQIPKVTDPPTLWRAKMKQTRKNKARLLNIIRKRGGGAAAPPAPAASESSAVRAMSAPDLLKFLEKPKLTDQEKKDALARLKELNAQ